MGTFSTILRLRLGLRLRLWDGGDASLDAASACVRLTRCTFPVRIPLIDQPVDFVKHRRGRRNVEVVQCILVKPPRRLLMNAAVQVRAFNKQTQLIQRREGLRVIHYAGFSRTVVAWGVTNDFRYTRPSRHKLRIVALSVIPLQCFSNKIPVELHKLLPVARRQQSWVIMMMSMVPAHMLI
ncbi:hypothetical protein [Paenibacillus sp. OV219]|uniref:hypothetical protein n=1 Tax=Paenibacillus sp. OV219 TaxID=1884377 RepID=UPI0008D2DF2B|nr:hypothetical protein [Paenibacillus sp. OV219]SEO41145.1 hypothetical protein SAMN05518847_107332 [Paenibacillus sp. OV219]